MPISVCPKDSSTFRRCSRVSSVTLTKGTGTGYNYTSTNYKYTPWYISRNNTNGITVIIENGVTSIGNYTFYNCTKLKSVTILNPDCSIYSSSNTIYYGATIRGYSGSTAYTYARRYGRTFEAITTSTQGNTMTSSTVSSKMAFSNTTYEAE